MSGKQVCQPQEGVHFRHVICAELLSDFRQTSELSGFVYMPNSVLPSQTENILWGFFGIFCFCFFFNEQGGIKIHSQITQLDCFQLGPQARKMQFCSTLQQVLFCNTVKKKSTDWHDCGENCQGCVRFSVASMNVQKTKIRAYRGLSEKQT